MLNIKQINEINYLKKNQKYLFQIKPKNRLDNKSKAISFFRKYGFCVLENVIPISKINTIKNEIKLARKKDTKQTNLYKELLQKEKVDIALYQKKGLKIRFSKHKFRPPKLPNEIIWMPEYSKYICHKVILDFAKTILDDHIRISQIHTKLVAKKNEFSSIKIGKDFFGLPRVIEGNANTREWHTDWPHDSWGGGLNSDENLGAIREPFPDVTMSLVMIWYLTDVDENNGGTWIIPGSHKFNCSPRNGKKTSVIKKIPGEMQIKAKAGSVFIQDSRAWHSSPIGLSKEERLAVINRWHPWWLELDNYAPNSRLNIMCRPLSNKDFNKLPKALKPLMIHLCNNKKESIQEPILKRCKASANLCKKYYKIEKK